MSESGAEISVAPAGLPLPAGELSAFPYNNGWFPLGQIARGEGPVFTPRPAAVDIQAWGTPKAEAPRRDIVDEIDELVEWQMSGGGRSPRCPHSWCGREWHGFPMTRRIERMRAIGRYDEAYSVRDDDSEVLCPGSTFEGEFEPPDELALAMPNIVSETERRELIAARWRATPTAYSRQLVAPEGRPPLRDVIVARWRQHADRYAQRKSIRDAITLTEPFHARGLILDRHRLHILDTDPGMLEELRRRTRSGRPLESFYAATYPGVLTFEQRRRLEGLHAALADVGHYTITAVQQQYIERSLRDVLIRGAEDEFWAGVIDPGDIAIRYEPGLATSNLASMAQWVAHWSPGHETREQAA